MTRGDVAVAPVNALLRLSDVAPRLHITIWVPVDGKEVVRILPPQRPQIQGPTPGPIRKMASVCNRAPLRSACGLLSGKLLKGPNGLQLLLGRDLTYVDLEAICSVCPQLRQGPLPSALL